MAILSMVFRLTYYAGHEIQPSTALELHQQLPNGGPFIYAAPREGQWIRVVELLPGSGAEPIKCSLRAVLLKSRPKYEALPYAEEIQKLRWKSTVTENLSKQQ